MIVPLPPSKTLLFYHRQKYLQANTLPTRLPKNIKKFTGHPETILKEYEDLGKQVYRIGFRTWMEVWNLFEESIEEGSRMHDYVQPMIKGTDFREMRDLAFTKNDGRFWYAMYVEVRKRMFALSRLDPNKPGDDARQEWRKIDFPAGSLSWKIARRSQKGEPPPKIARR